MVSVCHFFLLIAIVLPMINSAKILGIFSTPSKSHLIVHNSLMRGLAEQGHEVTIVRTIQFSQPFQKNYRDIYIPVSNSYEQLVTHMVNNTGAGLHLLSMFPAMMVTLCDISAETINHPKFHELMTEKFDLVVLGWIMNDFQLGVAAHFQCPSIIISSVKATKSLRDYVGSPSGISYVPGMLLSYSGQMTFFQRLINFIVGAVEYIATSMLNYYIYEPYYIKNFPPDRYPSLDEAKKNISLVFINNHFSQGEVQAYVPAMIEVGGMHIETKASPLPIDIQTWLDDAPDGAIFFSLGSNIKSEHISAEKRDAILRVFSNVKQKVLMKWEDDKLPYKPKNLMINKWLPQNDVLAHPNIKLFISHCGLSSVNEAKYHGVPILGIPLLGDQPTNLNLIAQEGWAVPLNFADINEETFSKALNEALDNPVYSETIKSISNLYKDRPQNPLETAIFWVEYVLRHNGAKHMQSQAVHLNVFQYHSLDVIGFIFVIIYIFVKMIKYIFKWIARKCRAKLFKIKKN